MLAFCWGFLSPSSTLRGGWASCLGNRSQTYLIRIPTLPLTCYNGHVDWTLISSSVKWVHKIVHLLALLWGFHKRMQIRAEPGATQDFRWHICECPCAWLCAACLAYICSPNSCNNPVKWVLLEPPFYKRGDLGTGKWFSWDHIAGKWEASINPRLSGLGVSQVGTQETGVVVFNPNTLLQNIFKHAAMSKDLHSHQSPGHPPTQILPLTFVWAYYITYLSILFLDAFQSRRHQNTSPRHFSMHTIKQNSYLSPALFLLKRNTCWPQTLSVHLLGFDNCIHVYNPTPPIKI